MNSIRLSLLLFFAVTALGAPAKFHRVLVLTGGGFQFGQFLGILDGLREAKGWEPDLVITTCGASFAGVLINAISDPKDRLDFLKSKAFHDELLGIKVRPAMVVGWKFSASVAELTVRSGTENPTIPIPEVFGVNAVLEVPHEFRAEVTTRKFSKQGIRLIMVGSRLHFGPEDVGKESIRGSVKLYTEVYFTDDELAPLLRGIQSPIATLYPKSAVAPATEVRTDLTLGGAARVSISDLKYLEPARLGDDYYAGGFVNLFPLELALEVAEEVVMIRSAPFGEVEQLVIKTTMGYDGNDRRVGLNTLSLQSGNAKRVKWIEMTGQSKMYEVSGLNPKFEKRGFFEPWVTMRVPVLLEDYASKVQAQYDWGFQTAKAAELK